MTYRTYWTLHHMFWFNSICIWIHIWYTWIVIFYKTSSTWIYECCTRKNTLLMDSNIVDECKSSLIKNNQAVITWSLWMLVLYNEEELSLYLKYANNTWKEMNKLPGKYWNSRFHIYFYVPEWKPLKLRMILILM